MHPEGRKKVLDVSTFRRTKYTFPRANCLTGRDLGYLMANKIKETEWVVPKKKDILDLIALQEGVPIEQLLAHVAPKPPDPEHSHTQPNPTQPNAQPARPR